MLTLLTADRLPYRLPTGWHEVTTAQYLALDAQGLATPEARASFFAWREVPPSAYATECLSFMAEPPPADAPTAQPYPADLGQETYLQVESIRLLLSTQPLHQCFGLAYGMFVARAHSIRPLHRTLYHQPTADFFARHCLDKPITETLPAVVHCLAELTRLNEKYAALAEPDPTEAGRRAQEAGAERLAMFGHLNVARTYGEKFGTSINDIYQRPWEEIALYLYQDREHAIILDNLQRNQSND